MPDPSTETIIRYAPDGYEPDGTPRPRRRVTVVALSGTWAIIEDDELNRETVPISALFKEPRY